MKWIKFFTIVFLILALSISLAVLFDIIGLRFYMIIYAVEHDFPVFVINFLEGAWLF